MQALARFVVAKWNFVFSDSVSVELFFGDSDPKGSQKKGNEKNRFVCCLRLKDERRNKKSNRSNMKHSYQVFEDFLKSHRLEFRGGMKESRRLINSTREKKSPNNEKIPRTWRGRLENRLL